MKNNIRKFENFHILLWLFKDLCWVLLAKPVGIFMILPTVALAIYITWKNRQERVVLAHNLAVCFWISANSIWMVGEFYFEDSLRPVATAFFLAGLVTMLGYYIPLVFRQRTLLFEKKHSENKY